MARELPKVYEPQQVESKIYDMWQQGGYFHAEVDESKKPFTIVMPPPNVTGQLHMGHAMDATLQDTLIRFKRMQGYNALWIPGVDHAGIATQIKVEEELRKEGLTRYDLGREKFLERVWDWKHKYGNRIVEQQKKLGASCDWERARFTMDEGCSKAVREVFVSLYEKGLIYKGSRIINWCPHCVTALSDAEVEYVDKPGHLWHIRYPLADGSGEVIVATTRPETMLGDSGVCVNPNDERYKDIVGKMVILPLVNKEIPVVADDYAEMDFGTGCVKMTPAHDPNDFEVGLRHNLEVIRVLDDNGKVNENGGKYEGLDRYEARKRIVADLEAGGYLVKVEPYSHNVGTCYRCHQDVEPIISAQWFVKMKPLAEEAIRVVKEGETKFVPERFSKTYLNWMENVRDWCISRQLWWGHQIPAWTCADCGHITVSREDVCKCEKCGSTNVERDPDVLDTWFSSALWPFETLGWPEKTEDLDYFYPTDVLVTGYDIIFFWVARMIFSGCEHTGKTPFHTVLIHGLVRDNQGRKMSKSLGNGIDPLEMIDKYGCDSLRFTLTAFAAMGRDIRLSEARIEGYRHFVNKLWNAARFALMNLPETAPAPVALESVEGLHHQWILHRLEQVKQDMDKALEEYRFNDAAQLGYKFLWNEFCDWYLELIKPDMQDEARKPVAQYVLWVVLRELLLLLHPIIPFVTAEIWNALPVPAGEQPTDIALELYPAARPGCLHEAEAARMELVQGIIVAVRTIKAELNISPSHKVSLMLHPVDEAQAALLESCRQMMTTLARLEDLQIGADLHAPKASASSVVGGCQVIVPLKGAVDLAGELARLDKEMAKLEKDLVGVQSKLHNESFVSRAPAQVVERERARAEQLLDAKAKMQALRQRFSEALNEE